MCCACPGRFEVSRGIVEAKFTQHHSDIRVPSIDLTHPNSCQLMSGRCDRPHMFLCHLTNTNVSQVSLSLSVYRCARSKTDTTKKRHEEIELSSWWRRTVRTCTRNDHLCMADKVLLHSDDPIMSLSWNAVLSRHASFSISYCSWPTVQNEVSSFPTTAFEGAATMHPKSDWWMISFSGRRLRSG